MLNRHRLVIAGLVVVLTSALVSYAVSAAVPSALRPSGTTRYAMVQSTSQTTDDDSDSGFEAMQGMATSINVPAGMKGDVIVVFCGETSAVSPTWIEMRAKAGGSVLAPTSVFMGAGSTQVNHCATFYKNNIPEGTRTVKIEWYASTLASVHDRNMIVIVNIHN